MPAGLVRAPARMLVPHHRGAERTARHRRRLVPRAVRTGSPMSAPNDPPDGTLVMGVELSPPVLTIILAGRLDASCVEQVRWAAQLPASTTQVVVVDLAGLVF